jgi:hypothetical protein
VLDLETLRPVDGEIRARALREMRRTGGMLGFILGRVGAPHEDADDVSTWGPADEDIDWAGFDA